MKTAILMGAVAVLWSVPARAETDAEIARQIVAIERQAMDGWVKGNPDPMLAISDPDITYYHVMTDKRLDGISAVRDLYERYRGTPLFDSYEMLDTKVQVAGGVAVLTYLFVRHNGAASSRWNATEVFQRKKEGWRIIHSHWSAVRSAQ